MRIAERLRWSWNRWGRLRNHARRALAARYKHELEAERIRWGLERAGREVRAFGCSWRRDRRGYHSATGRSGHGEV